MAKVLCVLGQYQYGTASRGLGIEYVSFLPALRRNGHDVIHFESTDKSTYKTVADINQRLLDKVIEVQPDVLFAVCSTHEIWLETIRLINKLGVSTICWTTDDSWKYVEHSRFLGRAFQCMTTTYSDKLAEYERDGIKNVLLTQWGACREALQPPLPSTQCQYDVTFVGAAHGSRAQSIQQLEKLGLKVTCFGYGWPNGSVRAEQIPIIMRNSRISLNFANSRGINQIKARNFEVPGAGGFLLAEHAPGLENYYIPGKEMVIFHSLEELAQQAQYYLSHPEERDNIAIAGYERTKKEHTYDVRMKEVIDFALKHRPEGSFINVSWARHKFQKYLKRSTMTFPLKLLRASMLKTCCTVWGPERGPRAARRITHELTWRIHGSKAFTSKGLTGRLFPHE